MASPLGSLHSDLVQRVLPYLDGDARGSLHAVSHRFKGEVDDFCIEEPPGKSQQGFISRFEEPNESSGWESRRRGHIEAQTRDLFSKVASLHDGRRVILKALRKRALPLDPEVRGELAGVMRREMSVGLGVLVGKIPGGREFLGGVKGASQGVKRRKVRSWVEKTPEAKGVSALELPHVTRRDYPTPANYFGNKILKRISSVIGLFPNLSRVMLQNNALAHLPNELICTQVAVLNIGRNYFREVPSVLEKLPYLTDLDLSNNLGGFDLDFGDACPIWKALSLEKLDLCSNRICFLSPKIVDLVNLQELHLSDNALSDLPALPFVEKLWLDGNLFSKIPKSLFELRSLNYLFLTNLPWIKTADVIRLIKAYSEAIPMNTEIHLDRVHADEIERLSQEVEFPCRIRVQRVEKQVIVTLLHIDISPTQLIDDLEFQ